MNWSNRKPDKNGLHWIVRKEFEDDVLTKTSKPEIVYITLQGYDENHHWMDYLGSDDSELLPTTDDLIIEKTAPRDLIFNFDSQEIADKKSKDLVKLRYEYWIKPQHVPSFEKEEIDEYPVLHQKGMLTVEMRLVGGVHVGDVGVQIANDGRIWVCFDGGSFIRFKPLSEKKMRDYESAKQRRHYEGR